MLRKKYITTVILALFVVLNAISQEIIEKNFFNTQKELGGDVTVLKSIIKVEGSKSYKIFEIESPDNGSYYLNTWMMGGELENFGSGKFLEYDLTVNTEEQSEKFIPLKSNWHNAPFSDSKSKEKKLVQLKKGLNQIIFSCDVPETPEIEFVRLSKDKSKAEISEKNYIQFIDNIKSEIQERIKNPIIKKDSLTTDLRSGVVLSNPEGN